MVQTSKGSSGGMLTGGGSSSVFGASSADVMTKITRWTGVIFIILALVLSFLFAKSDDKLIPEATNDPETFEAAPELKVDAQQETATPITETKSE